MAKEPKKLIANNKKVYHDYFLLEKYEAGISLAGTEVKSLRMGKGSIKESFIRIENGEIILYGISHHMRREISSTRIHSDLKSFCSTRRKSRSFHQR